MAGRLRASSRERHPREQPVRRAFDTTAAAVEDVGVDHRRSHLAVAEQFLHRANVVSRLQQMRRKLVPHRMWPNRLAEPRSPRGVVHRLLQYGFVHVPAKSVARTRIDTGSRSGKHPLRTPFLVGVRILARQGVRQWRAPESYL
jgi:hypothetical protein